MVKTTLKYNPAFMTENELIDAFVVRHAELEKLVSIVRDNTEESIQHVAVSGRRGMGKTMLVRRLAYFIKNNEELKRKWQPIIFGEESYQVFTAGEFWLEALGHLAHQSGSDALMEAYKTLEKESDDKRLCDRSLAYLTDYAKQNGKRLLLIVENMDQLIGKQFKKNEDWKLRKILSNEPAIMLIGTSVLRFNKTGSAEKALWELLKPMRLKPLKQIDCQKVFQQVCGRKITRRNLRPIHILTGGNPRLLSIISEFAAGASIKTLMKNLSSLVDQHTTYLKSNIDSLAALERKVFITLADLWNDSTSREVADAARISINKSSANLKRLVDKGAVIEVSANGKLKSYRIAERLYNIYHLMRRRGGDSARVKLVMEFMNALYEQEEVSTFVKALSHEACSMESGERKFHYSLLGEVLNNYKRTTSVYAELKKSISPEFLKLKDIPQELSSVLRGDEKNEGDKEGFGELEDFGIEAQISDIREQLTSFPYDYSLWMTLGIFLLNTTNGYAKAEEAFRKVIEIKGGFSAAWMMLGFLLHEKLERYEEAEESYRSAIKYNPKEEFAWMQLGRLLHEKLERYEEAEKAYRKAIELDPRNTIAYWPIIRLQYQALSKPELAAETIAKCLQANDRSPESLNGVAWEIYSLNWSEQMEFAQSLALEAVQKESEQIFKKQSQHTLACVNGALGKWPQALALAKEILGDRNLVKQRKKDLIDFFIFAAASGQASEAAKALERSESADIYEPLLVALKLEAGKEVRTAKEIRDVAEDLLEMIGEKRQEIKARQ
jgi:tetratricopeptide (TPR) repeat protein